MLDLIGVDRAQLEKDDPALMADLLLSQLEGEPLPLENDLADALDPGRFLIKTGRCKT